MRNFIFMILAAAVLVLAPPLSAQDEGHVIVASSLISQDAVAPGETFKAAIVVKVQAGYHINDNAPLDEFMIPTTLVIDDHPDLRSSRSCSPKAGGPASPHQGRLSVALHVALIEPLIPPNTGNIARLCVATDSSLHLIEPLGFSLEDREVRRAGLDYWQHLDLWVHPHWRAFREAMSRERCYYLSSKAANSLWDARFEPNACLVFGNETAGMPDRILEKHPERCFRIPMVGPVRNLNPATAAGIALYEALRQVSGAARPRRRRRLPARGARGGPDESVHSCPQLMICTILKKLLMRSSKSERNMKFSAGPRRRSSRNTGCNPAIL